jgi:hypothetical protein
MPAAGETIIAGKVPGERIATTIATATSAGVTTTETTIDSVTAALVNGRTYRIRWVTQATSTVASDRADVRIRLTSPAGSQLQSRSLNITSTTAGADGTIEAEYTAASTGNQVFAGTVVRGSGTGTITCPAATNRPRYLYVDYISG